VSPARRRRAVATLRGRLGVSERWACRVVGQHRSTERYEPAGDGPAGRDGNAAAPDDVWALGFRADQTADGRALRLANVVDGHTREALVMHAGRSMTRSSPGSRR